MTDAAHTVDLRGLETLALSQGGYFDRADALAHGLSNQTIYYHAGTGRFARVMPGVFRLGIALIGPLDDLWRAWVWSNYRGAISHESALALFDLSDVMPAAISLTVPPAFNRTVPPGFTVHRAPLHEEEVTIREGIAVTTPARTIVDAAATGMDPAQVCVAVRQALDRALATPEALRRAAARRGYRHSRMVRSLIERAIRLQAGDAPA